MSRTRTGRRNFLMDGAAVGSAAGLGAARARECADGLPWRRGEANPPRMADAGRSLFFTVDELRFVEAAIDRLIPPDEWPGASELGVGRFLDSQLAGAFGRADIWYMQGPWAKGVEKQASNPA